MSNEHKPAGAPRTSPAVRGRQPARTARLATTCIGALALATLGAPEPAQARGFQGTGSVIQGSAAITTGATQTAIDVQSAQVVIDWTADADTPLGCPRYPIDFLPVGSTATFSGSGDAAGGYVVLNRVLLDRAAGFNGTVQSYVGTATGGEVWFYSPNGIYVGPRAAFDVGSLVLTANDIDSSDGLYGADGQIRFRGAPSSTAAVRIDRGARLSAVGDNAYLAIVAPSIAQQGDIAVDGSAALVAAEQADIRFHEGMVDIVVTQGTTAANAIFHTGSTGGPVTGAPQTIRMVAIPKNDAVTMLLAGSIGYQPAAQASTQGTAVVLEAGTPDAPAAIQMGAYGGLVLSSPTTAYASDKIDVAPAVLRRVDFLASADLSAGGSVTLSAAGDSEITARAGLTITAGSGGTGGAVTIVARHLLGKPDDIGRIDLGDFVAIDVDGRAEVGDAAGGSVTFDAAGGSIAAGRIAIEASGFAAGEGRGSGGDVLLRARGGGTIAAALTEARAEGIGGSAGGDGLGGAIAAQAIGGSLALGDVRLDVDAAGGSSAGRDGGAVAGAVSIGLDSAAQRWNSLTVAGGAVAGDGAPGVGGRLEIAIAPAGELRLDGALDVGLVGRSGPNQPSVSLHAADGALRVGGAAQIATSGAVDLVLGPAGTAEIADALRIETPGRLRASGAISAGSVAIRTGRAVDIGGAISSGGALSIAAGGAASFGGPVVAPTITIEAADLAIAPDARIGARGTTSTIAVRKRLSAPSATIGGAAASGGFVLDAAELARFSADESIALDLPFSGDGPAGAVTLGDLALGFGPEGHIGAGGALRIETNGDVAVRGAVELATASEQDSFRLAARNIALAAESGRIVLGDSGALGGRLALQADTIAAAENDVLALIAGGADPAAVTAALARPAPGAGDGGFLQAARIDAAIGDGFYVQNSGVSEASNARRGFSANALAITTGETAAFVMINGRSFTAGGAPLTGANTFQSLTVNGEPVTPGAGLRAGSSVNGCVPGGDCTPPSGAAAPDQSTIRGSLEGERIAGVPGATEALSRQDGISLLARNDTLNASAPLAVQRQLLPYLAYTKLPDPAQQSPLIDEPITGVGNDDLWQGQFACDAGSDCFGDSRAGD